MNQFLRMKFASILTFTFMAMPPPLYAQMIVGHRGASEVAPENTLTAFKEAWRQNADGIEGDFYLTRDNEIVCIHDADTQRTGGRKLDVRTSTLAELNTLEFGAWKAEKYRGERIPTLQDVLEIIPAGKTCVIELKMGPEIVPRLKEILESKKFPSKQTLIISFDENTIASAKKLMPERRAHWLTSYKTNLLTGKPRPDVKQIIATLKKCQADGLGTKGAREIVTPEFVKQLRDAGMKEFHVWTVDDADDARYFQKLGAIGITTNRPGRIREELE